MGNINKAIKYRIGSSILVFDQKRAEEVFRHPRRISAVLLFASKRDAALSQAFVDKVAGRVYGLKAVVNNARIELYVDVRPGSSSISDVVNLINTFVEEANRVLTERHRRVAAHSAKKATARSGYRNDPPTRR